MKFMVNSKTTQAHRIILDGAMIKKLKRNGVEVATGALRPIRSNDDVPRILRRMDEMQKRTVRGGSRMRFAAI